MGDLENSREPASGRNGAHSCKPTETSDFDTLLPVQYYESVAGGRSPSGEFKLFFAILEDALRCYVRAKNCRSGAKRAEFADARRWFFTRGMPHVFSFESICAFLNINSECLRARLESLQPSDLPLKQFHTRRRNLARPPSHSSGCGRASTTPSPNGLAAVSGSNGTAPESRQ